MIFFITVFRYFIFLFYSFHCLSLFLGMQTRERAHCARSVFPFIKKENAFASDRLYRLPVSSVLS